MRKDLAAAIQAPPHFLRKDRDVMASDGTAAVESEKTVEGSTQLKENQGVDRCSSPVCEGMESAEDRRHP